ncbi:MAG: nucleoside deaminase [bacterium]|nr:nucleoside deaminase [Candidatus Minthenecus merdequi]
MDDDFYMNQALAEARKAKAEDEIPVGAVIVAGDRIIARAYNQTERLKDVTAHAEMLAITAAANTLGAKYLTDCTLYVTLEPCTMCAAALRWCQISRVVYGAEDDKNGYKRFAPEIMHPKTKVEGGVKAEECSKIVTSFFEEKRRKKL